MSEQGPGPVREGVRWQRVFVQGQKASGRTGTECAAQGQSAGRQALSTQRGKEDEAGKRSMRGIEGMGLITGCKQVGGHGRVEGLSFVGQGQDLHSNHSVPGIGCGRMKAHCTSVVPPPV